MAWASGRSLLCPTLLYPIYALCRDMPKASRCSCPTPLHPTPLTLRHTYATLCPLRPFHRLCTLRCANVACGLNYMSYLFSSALLNPECSICLLNHTLLSAYLSTDLYCRLSILYPLRSFCLTYYVLYTPCFHHYHLCTIPTPKCSRSGIISRGLPTALRILGK